MHPLLSHPMSNTFVLSRLLPAPSLYWTSWYGKQAASALSTRPFLAFRISSRDVPEMAGFNPSAMLFVVSPQKPVGIYEGCYFALNPGSDVADKTLTVVPPLPSIGCPFYLHAFRLAVSRDSYDAVMRQDKYSPLHRLDEQSLRKFCNSVWPIRLLLRARQDQERRRGRSGGYERVEDTWDTFSGRPPQDGLNNPYSCMYELVPCTSEALPMPAEPSTIYREIMQYNQTAAEYSWSGVTAAISGVQKMREIAQMKSLSIINVYNTDDVSGNEVPELTGELAVTADSLRTMRIPYDGDPPPVQDVDTVDDDWWDDGPVPEFQRAPESCPSVAYHDLKVIVFDLDGVVVDHESAIQAALSSLVPFSSHDDGEDKLLAFFLECFALQRRELGPAVSDTDLCRAAIIAMAEAMGTSLQREMVEKALERMTDPQLYADVEIAMKTLQAGGLALVCLSAHENTASSYHIFRGLPPGVQFLTVPGLATMSEGDKVDSTSPPAFATLLEHCNLTLPGTTAQQVLLATAGRFRVVEPAAAVGVPTALICRPGNLESHVSLDGQSPTMTVDGLAGLCTQLGFTINASIC